jgi:anhydro-N-acetylmuramic acid kinase
VFPLIKSFGITHNDGLKTYVEHIVAQVKNAVQGVLAQGIGDRLRQEGSGEDGNHKLLVTGGGALNTFLMDRLKKELKTLGVEVAVPDETIINYKEALITALIGVLRWRQEYNTFASVTGAGRDSIGGAVWITKI